jgi:hypothetical protein
MSIIGQARVELARVNFGEEDSKVMIEVLEKFLEQWDSGGAVSVASQVLVRLISGQPLSPLTGADDEWRDPMGDGIMLQNARCSSVFKTWKDPATGDVSQKPLMGVQVVNNIYDPSWDGNFPYDPSTRLPQMPVLEVEVSA